MRPIQIEVEGFSAYRGKVTVPFEGVDFFSLTGPTGSGKSSLIDAMIFALFGRVPRLGGNAVAPAITAGADRARVRFDFEVSGEQFTAARLAQRTATGGASVREARLQKGDEILADGADDVTTAVEELLRLRFEDFTRTVVLPQGDFARFLTATKAERQGLLRNLFGFDVYTTVRELAKTREAVASDRADTAERTIDALDVPDEESVAKALDRLTVLDELSSSIAEKEKALLALDSEVEELRGQDRRVADRIDRLVAVEVPANLEAHESSVIAARSAVVDTEEAIEAAREAVVSAEAAVADLPAGDQIKAWRRNREKLEEVEKRLAESEIDELKKLVEQASEALEVAEADMEKAREATNAARAEHSAHELAGRLAVGESCPVCAQEVSTLPDLDRLPLVTDLERAESESKSRLEGAREVAEQARTRLVSVESAVKELEAQKTALSTELTGAPATEELEAVTDRLQAAHKTLDESRENLLTCENQLKSAADHLADLTDASRRISKELTAVQLKLAQVDLEPPLSESDDPVVQWKELSLWRDETLDSERERRTSLQREIEETVANASTRRSDVVAVLRGAGLEGIEPYSVEVATATQAARTTVENHKRAIAEAEKLTKLTEESRTEAAVAGTLANHLRANGFERWLMVGALTELVAGANDLLDDLSGGGYSLHTDDSGDFSIVDHRNADEKRSVATLSGGETFLVSLALALSLAETLAAKGGSGLDAIILDEGFGTLDDESLDTVASVLEELSGKGLMVGIITHVKELAVRAPVRYEVTREPQGATVRLAS